MRRAAGLLVYLTGWCLCIGAFGYIAGILVEKLLAYPVLISPIIWFSIGCAAIGCSLLYGYADSSAYGDGYSD
jgi:hypothetical protein